MNNLLLYGSYARNDNYKDSDVDLLSIGKSQYTKKIIKNNINLTQYPYGILKKMALSGSLFIYHLKEESEIDSLGVKREISWLGESFDDFLDAIPKRELHRQIYMFSKKFDSEEAYNNIISLSHFFVTEDFKQGVGDLSSKLGIQLSSLHLRKSKKEVKINKATRQKLRKLLKPEIKLYNRLLEYKKNEKV